MTVSRKNIASYVSDVGSKLDLVITSNTIPSLAQVTSWLEDGFMRMIMMLPSSQLTDLSTTAAIPAEDGLPSRERPLDFPVVRPISAVTVDEADQYDRRPCIIVPYGEWSVLRSFIARFSDLASPYVSFVGNPQRLLTWPVSTRDIDLVYVGWPPEAYLWPETHGSPPLEWEQALVDYATAQGRLQDEEPESGQLAMQQWQARLVEMARTGVYAVNGGTP